MDKSFDLGFVFKNREAKHKTKPTQFMSVAGGVQKRRESNLKYRKSCRLSKFDNARDLSDSDSPKKPVNEAELKIEHRRQQLEKWKEEKEAKKKQLAKQKKKPFVAGVVHAPLMFVPPPPPKAMPSSSGRVTRSQSARIQNAKKEIKTTTFAPKSSTTFKPPQIKTTEALPVFPSTKSRQKPTAKVNVTFEPVVPNKVNVKEPARVAKSTRNNASDKSKVKPKPSPKKLKKNTKLIESSTESSTEILIQEKPKKRATRKSSTHNFVIETVQKSPVIQTKSRKSILNTTSESQESIVLPSRKTPRKSIAKDNKINSPKTTTTPKNKPIPKSESSSEEKLRSPKEASPMTPEQIVDAVKNISPNVTMSRGKDNARREMKQKLKDGLLDEDASDMASVEHFRRQMDSEVRRMTLMCEYWDELYSQTALPEFVQELVLTAVGQARLLMSQKLRQFSGLVARCAARDAAAGLVVPADLAGFWDMLFIQIENIDVRFKQLETLRARGWREEPPSPRAARPPRARPAPAAARPAARPASKIRDLIAAARKAKKVQESISNSSASSVSPMSIQSSDQSQTNSNSKTNVPVKSKTPEKSNTPVKSKVAEELESKTFEAGFFCVKSPVRSPSSSVGSLSSPVKSCGTPARVPGTPSLLKCVLSSEARKASFSKSSPASFAMLRASLLGKGVGIEGVSPLEQTPKNLQAINLDATPARSILKSAQKPKKSAKKSIKTVLFDKSDIESSPYESAKDFVLLDITPTKEKEALDSGVSSMDADFENKENKTRRQKLSRQQAIDLTPAMMTRSRRKSIQAEEDRVLSEVVQEDNNKTPKRHSRRNKSMANEKTPQNEDLIDFSTPKEQPRRTRRAKRSQV